MTESELKNIFLKKFESKTNFSGIIQNTGLGKFFIKFYFLTLIFLKKFVFFFKNNFKKECTFQKKFWTI